LPDPSRSDPTGFPTGIVTFLFTDVEASTRLWEQHPQAMRQALLRHDRLAVPLLRRHHGTLVKERGEGDSLFAVFARATDAVEAACALQRALIAEAWPSQTPLRVRMALHTGEADLRHNDYYGAAVNRCARLRAIAHGGQILISQSTQTLVTDALPEGVTLRDLGAHRLRDLQRPENVYQILHPSLPSDFAPLTSLEAFAHNLPVQLTSFIGRSQELAEISQLLPTTRLLTLKGAGGCGKTRLSLQVAAEVLELYREGVWFVELAALSDPERITQTVASLLGVREAPGVGLISTLSEALRSRSLLLILDNCEHLVSACAHFADALLRACPQLRILSTSREALSIAGETVWEVPPLSKPDPKNLPSLAELAHNEAVHLFVERAQAAKPRFRLTPQNAPSVANICHRLDGLPFAIELAAAKVDLFTVEEIDELLFSLLDEAPVTAPDRHKTMQSLLDWSYNLLQEPEQALLRRLSIFAGGWTRRASQEVCVDGALPAGQVLRLLARLVRSSLVSVEEHGETTRYRLLETVREYGSEKMRQTGEEAPLQDRYVTYYYELAKEGEPHLTGPEQAKWLHLLETEHDNLRCALRLAVDNETRLQMVGRLGRFWTMRGYFSEGRAWLKGALDRGGRSSPAARAKALTELGVLAWRQGDYAAARQSLEEGLEIQRQLNNERGIAVTLPNLGHIAREQGDYTTAFALFEQSLTVLRKLNDRWGTAALLNNMGMLARDRGDADAARSYYEQGLSIYRELGDSVQIAVASNNLAMLVYDQQDYETARALDEEALQIFEKLGNRPYAAISRHNLAGVVHKLEGYAAAKPLYIASLLARRDLGDKAGIPYALTSLADVAKDAGDYPRAIQLSSASLSLCETLGNQLPQSVQQEIASMLDPLREKVSKDEFEAAWERGKRMSMEEIVAYAIE
jgi:predicted ATPase/class 3 adenylate cyclase